MRLSFSRQFAALLHRLEMGTGYSDLGTERLL
jgi:hypothetical protein